jgi:thymidylate synthase (FAD)
MRIIDQSYAILSIPDNPLQLIEQSGRVCYKSENKIGCTESHNDSDICSDALIDSGKCINTHCNTHSSHKFVRMLRDRKHDAMLEFGDLTVKFITNRGVLAELSRHRLVSLAVESTRYVNYKGGMEFILPVWFKDQENFSGVEKQWLSSMVKAEECYSGLLDLGWRPEQAREVLPNSLKTEIVAKANYREWRHILKLRTSTKSHPQMRNLMLPLLAELKTKIPVVFDDIPLPFKQNPWLGAGPNPDCDTCHGLGEVKLWAQNNSTTEPCPECFKEVKKQ